MQCPQCHAEVIRDAVFCQHCGERLMPDPNEPPGPLDPAADPSSPFAAASARSSPAAAARSTSSGDKLSLPRTLERDDTPEQELWRGTYSPRAMMPHAVGHVFLSIIIVVAAVLLHPSHRVWWAVSIFVLLILVAPWVRLGLKRMGILYRLTNQRLIHERGLLSRQTNRIDVIDIDDVSFEQGMTDRMLGVGTIKISSTDHNEPILVLQGIDGVRAVADQIDQARRHERLRRGMHIETT